jgi:hypothetical protein
MQGPVAQYHMQGPAPSIHSTESYCFNLISLLYPPPQRPSQDDSKSSKKEPLFTMSARCFRIHSYRDLRNSQLCKGLHVNLGNQLELQQQLREGARLLDDVLR